MVRINLLPSYVLQRRQTRLWTAVFTVLLIAIVVVFLTMDGIYARAVADMTQKATAAQSAHDHINDLETQATGIISQIGPIQTKVKFVNDVAAYNVEAPQLYERIARWTSPSIYYSAMAVNDQDLDIRGYTHSIADLGRYLQYMYNEPDVTSVSLQSSLPTYSSAVQRVILYRGHPVTTTDPGAVMSGPGYTVSYRYVDSFQFEVHCTLKQGFSMPSPPGSAAPGASDGGGGGGGGNSPSA